MTPADHDALLHMLGLDADTTEPWRNHFVTDGADPCMARLVAAGFAEELRRPSFLAADDHVYGATADGRAEAIRECHRRRQARPKPSRAKARYHAWLDCADASGASFGEYLRRRLYEATP